MKISIAGIGYVGLFNAILLSQKNTVDAFDISRNRVDQFIECYKNYYSV